MAEPRIAPITPEECDEDTKARLDGLGSNMTSALNIFTTLAHHPHLLKRWSTFGGVLLYRGELDPREREILISCGPGGTASPNTSQGVSTAIGLAAGLTEKEVDATTLDPAAAEWATTTMRCLSPRPTGCTQSSKVE